MPSSLPSLWWLWKEELPSSVFRNSVVRLKWHLWLCCCWSEVSRGCNVNVGLPQMAAWVCTAHCAYPAWTSQLPCCLREERDYFIQISPAKTCVHLCPCRCPPELLFSHWKLQEQREARFYPSLFQKGLRRLILTIWENPRLLPCIGGAATTKGYQKTKICAK